MQTSLHVQVLPFPILAALLHGTPAVGISQNLWRSAEGATYVGRVAIMLGIGPHSSFYLHCVEVSQFEVFVNRY